MPNRNEVYKCTHCGNIVEVLNGGKAPLICCGEPMKHMVDGQTAGAKEKGGTGNFAEGRISQNA